MVGRTQTETRHQSLGSANLPAYPRLRVSLVRSPPTYFEEALERAALVIVGGLLAGIVGMYLYVLYIVVKDLIS